MELKFSKLNKRQEAILSLIDKRFKISVSEIVLDLAQKFPRASNITVIRDLNQLLKFNFISRIGRGRSVAYQLSNQYNFLKPIDIDRYFKIGPDQREAKKGFNFKIIKPVIMTIIWKITEAMLSYNKLWKPRKVEKKVLVNESRIIQIADK